MINDIKRATEVFICGKLTDVVPDHSFLPFMGFTGNEEDLEPPYTVVALETPEKTMQQQGVWFCRGNAQVITHIKEATSAYHSQLVRKIYAALAEIRPYGDPQFIFHGIDIESMNSADDSDHQCHADIIRFTCGVSG